MVGCNFSSFTSDFTYLAPLFFLIIFHESGKKFINVVYIFKETALCFTDPYLKSKDLYVFPFRNFSLSFKSLGNSLSYLYSMIKVTAKYILSGIKTMKENGMILAKGVKIQPENN